MIPEGPTRRRDSIRLEALAPRRGVTLTEVVVAGLVIGLVFLVVLASLPRQRENARLAGCRRNLMQIGVALALYEGEAGALPTVPPLGNGVSTASPLKALLETLRVPDFSRLEPEGKAARPEDGPPLPGRPVPGFTCLSDTGPGRTLFPAPISYRATAGDLPEGRTGGFAPGRRCTLAEIEDGDGKAFTAAFAERLLGTGADGSTSAVDYATVSGPVGASGCAGALAGSRRGDAGSSWDRVGWKWTLYNHALPPGGAPSCVAEDGTSALIGASSGHAQGVNVLIFDGSVRTVRPTMSAPLWKALATTHSPASKTEESR